MPVDDDSCNIHVADLVVGCMSPTDDDTAAIYRPLLTVVKGCASIPTNYLDWFQPSYRNMAEAGTRSSLRKQCICLVIVCRVHCTCITTALLYMLDGRLGYQRWELVWNHTSSMRDDDML